MWSFQEDLGAGVVQHAALSAGQHYEKEHHITMGKFSVKFGLCFI